MPAAKTRKRSEDSFVQQMDQTGDEESISTRPRSRSRSRSRDSRVSSLKSSGTQKSVAKVKRTASEDLHRFSMGKMSHHMMSVKSAVTLLLLLGRVFNLAYYVKLPRDISDEWRRFSKESALETVQMLMRNKLSTQEIFLYLSTVVGLNTLVNFSGLSNLNVSIIQLVILALKFVASASFPDLKVYFDFFIHPQRFIFIAMVHALVEVFFKQFVARIAASQDSGVRQAKTRGSKTKIANPQASLSSSFVAQTASRMLRFYTNFLAAECGDLEIRSALLTIFFADHLFLMSSNRLGYLSYAFMIVSANSTLHFIKALQMSARADNMQTFSIQYHHLFLENGVYDINCIKHLMYLMQNLVFDPFFANISLYYVISSPYMQAPGLLQILAIYIMIGSLLSVYTIAPWTLHNLSLMATIKRSFKPRIVRLLNVSVFAQIAIYALLAVLTNEKSIASLVHVDHILVDNAVDLFLMAS